MNVIVNKIYNELQSKADIINKKKLEKVDITEELNSEEFALIKEYEEIENKRKQLEEKRKGVLNKLKEKFITKYTYSLPTSESFIRSAKTNKTNPISINRGDIEASVILSDVADLDTLIKTITEGIIKKYPELKTK